MSQLKVYKASAGSGKTFRLAIEYMKLALTSESNYRHILAVTFTNKATAEMKSRIIGELYHLAKGKHSVYMDVLVKELGWPPVQVERQAQLVLKRILHDYSRFSISTIDSFFQRVIKAFNRELGINAAYNVELDEKNILEEAADRMIQSIDKDENLLEWLNAFASDKIREGQGWNLKKDILRLGNEIYNETFKSLNEETYEKLNDRKFLREYREKLTKIIAQYENRIKSIGKETVNLMVIHGFTADDFKRKSGGSAGSFQKMKDFRFEPSATVLRSANDISEWVTASVKEPQKKQLTAFAESKLMPKLQEAIQLIETQKRNYNTAKLIVNQLYTLGILVDLRKSVKELSREKGVILISDSGHLLKDVIADSETPFVYEKTGSVYSHFMIDEFQDTSGLQWNNFRPLIGNSLSEDNMSLVVGDVKQSIYRWRSGDWRLLAGKLGESFPAFGLQNEVLNSNWRSHGKIIRFNNTVFRIVPQLLQQFYEGELVAAEIANNPVPITIPEVYADSVQKVSNSKVSELGYVKVHFMDSKNDKTANRDAVFTELVEAIKSLQDKGVKAIDIAILVRLKKEASEIAELFLEQKNLSENQGYNFDILSGESLFIASSEVIAFLIAILTAFLNPDDQVVRAEVSFLYYQKIAPRLREKSQESEVRSPKSEERLPEREAVEGEGKAESEVWSPKSEEPLPEREAVEGRFTTLDQPDLQQQFEKSNSAENKLLEYLTSRDFQELIAGKPILEIIYSICDQFNLFSLADELAYLQAFVDQISIFERNHASELTSFLNWWEDNGDRFTIPISDSIDAINVLTIHKSKGLEFSYVFVPFFDWTIQPHTSPEMAPLLWCTPDVEPFNEMELVPVRYKKEVGDSIFYREYFTEKFNTYVDNLNLMYVVFTRAKAGLWIWASFSETLKSAGDMLKQSVDRQILMGESGLGKSESVQFAAHYDPEKLTFELGEISVLPEENKDGRQTMKDVRLTNFEFVDFRKFLNIRKHGENFFTSESKRQSGINKGKLIHEILSLIETTNDLDRAINRIQTDGKIGTADALKIKHELNELLNDPEVKSWFDGTYRIVNERNILTGANGIKRPDRMMIGADQCVVVDYKSGDMESDKYKYQLRNYIQELKNCGYPNVSGYIWYTKTNKRVKI